MNVEIYSCSRVLLKLLSSAEVFRGSSADLPRIFRDAGEMTFWPNSRLMRIHPGEKTHERSHESSHGEKTHERRLISSR